MTVRLPFRCPVLPALLVTAVLGASISVLAAPDDQDLETTVLEFTAHATSSRPQWDLSEGQAATRTLHFRLPGLKIHGIRREGQSWKTLDISGAAEHGAIGEPGLPVVSRLVAVPAGMILTARYVDGSRTTLRDLHLLPVQDPATEGFAYSPSAYTRKSSQGKDAPVFQVGDPAILAGQTVVPLSIHPVSYEPGTREATLWTDATFQLEFVPDPQAPVTPARSRPVPASFARQMSTQVLGYGSAELTLAGDSQGGLGTYAAVHSGHPSVVAGIAELLRWRREQGYHVVEVNTGLFGGTNTAIKNALKNIYFDETIPPLEFVTIFGDVGGDFAVAAWTENLSGYQGGGDHYYSTLDGDDILADVHIGRVSVRDASQLAIVMEKILSYEQDPPMDDTAWFGRACLQGDPSASGITTIYTNQWVKGQLQAKGWSHIDTTWSGNFATQMIASVGPGASAYGYRGYLGTSGISNGYVESLTNGKRLPIALLPTCDSGSFASSVTCRSEAWLRASSGGAVAAVGTATIGTHTRYNNCYYLGTWDALLNGGDYRIGAAHTGGKIALYNGYYLAEPNRAEIWAVWNNLMGDGATEMWTGVPQYLDVTCPTQISLGAQAVAIGVTRLGFPQEGARVSLYQETSGYQGSALTDASGQVLLNLPDLPAGTVTVTVTGHDLFPYQSGLTIGPVDVFCGATDRTLDDGGDGALNPGETASITPFLTNHGSTDAFSVNAELTVLSGPATITGGSLGFGTIAAGAEVGAATAAEITIAPDARDGDLVKLLVTATDGQESWTSWLEETVQAGAFQVSAVDLSNFGGNIDPGESGSFHLTLDNLGSIDATAVTAGLSCNSPWIIISDGTGSFGDIPSGENGQNLISPFQVTAAPESFGGHLVVFDLTIGYNNGLQAVSQFALTIGTAATDQPSGPDAFGYYAFDNTDTVSPLAPTYDWVAIDPDHGGLGTDLGLTDFGWEQDDIKTVTLPFTFSFYGEAFDQASICSNGWLAMGETPVVFYRNFPLPASHSAGSLIAPFWDNLYQTGSHKVYTWYDEAEHRFIIQWYQMLNDYSNAQQNFQVILLDPVYHPTSTGDGLILFQYDTVHNTDARDGYATVGIQNQDRTCGLNYSYWNQYAPGAAPLVSGRAILFAPLGEILLPAATVAPASIAQSVEPGGQVTEYLHISNGGEEGSVLDFHLTVVDPAILGPGKALADDSTGFVEPNSLQGSTVTSSVAEYDAGSTVDLPLLATCSSPDNEWLMELKLDLPLGVTVNSATAIAGGSHDILWNGETGEGVLTTWGSQGSGRFLSSGQTGNGSINLTFSSELAGDVIIGWEIFGDVYGSPPHEISGEIVLSSMDPAIHVTAPTSGQTAYLGEDLAVSFSAHNGPVMVNFALQRELDGPWETLELFASAEASPWIWTVSGEPGPYAVIRVSDAMDGSIFGMSGVFRISRNLDWVQPQLVNGEVPSGQTLDLAVILDATDLDVGPHQANLVVSSNGGQPVVVPLELTVGDISPVGDLPGVVTLLGNYPNPFNPQTLISFSLPADQDLTLDVYAVGGHLIRSLLQGRQPAGVHRVLWTGRDSRDQAVASGVYFYRLETDGQVWTGKMLLTK